MEKSVSFLDAKNQILASIEAFSPNWEQISFLLVGLILVILLSIVITLFVVENNKTNHFKKEINNQSASIRVFYINRPRNYVRYFNLSSMSDVKIATMEGFYSSFPVSEQERVRNWIDGLLGGKNEQKYLQVDVYFKKERRTMSSFLHVDSVNVAEGILHLESYLLHFDKPFHTAMRNFSSEGELAQVLKINGNNVGYTFCFTLCRGKTGLPGFDPHLKDSEVSNELFLRFKNALFPYVSGNEKAIRLSNTEIVVVNFDMIDMSNAIFYALRVKDGVDKALDNGKRRTSFAKYQVQCGIVSNRDVPDDSDALLEAARKSAYNATETTTDTLAFFSKGDKIITPADELHYRSEVDRIIYEKKLSFSYRPIYDVNEKKIYGYMARAVPIGTSFGSIDELKNYAIRAKDEKSLFAAIAKHLVPTFVAERMEKSHRLFFPARMDERMLITSFFPHYNAAKEANLIFLFKEEDIANYIDPASIDTLFKFIATIKRNGFGFAIYLKGKALVLDRSIYEECDAFFVDFSSRSETNMDTAIRSELHALVERLMRYKKPIIGTNLMNWNAIELVVGSKVEYISSDSFAPYDAMFKPINSKSIDRVKSMIDRK